jgi:uncharacterized protein YciI
MYAIAMVRYRKPVEDVLKIVEAHRAYLKELKQKGWLLASGPIDPRSGGALLLRVPDQDVQGSLDSIRDHDPFVRSGTAQYEIWPWLPNIGKEDLERL